MENYSILGFPVVVIGSPLHEMTRECERRPSGLIVQKHQPTAEERLAEREAAYSEYRRQHACCPKCGSGSVGQHCVGYVVADMKDYQDLNRSWCGCGWKGIAHDRVPLKEST